MTHLQFAKNNNTVQRDWSCTIDLSFCDFYRLHYTVSHIVSFVAKQDNKQCLLSCIFLANSERASILSRREQLLMHAARVDRGVL